MKKFLLKILSFVGALLFCGVFSTANIAVRTTAAATEPIPIDMYLIAGQSNAAGYSKKGVDQLTETFENVGYGGEVQRYFRTGDPSTSSYLDYEDFVWGVRSGLGSSEGYVGPEYGIAKTINDRYENTADGRKAFIFKTAAGGTSLLDKDDKIDTTMGNWGNWYPRSLWEDGYAPNVETYDENNDATGYLYALFLKNFEHVYNELKDNGYAPVIKGLAWMQGCQDLTYPDEYESVLKTFINDIRSDLVAITNDVAVNSMPFIIGKIATSFGEYGNPNVPAFNAMQQKVADDLGNSVDTVETSDLIIVNPDGSYNGTDQYHFNAADAQILGERFGEKLLSVAGQKIVSVEKSDGGSVSYDFAQDGKLTITVTPTVSDKKYRVTKLLVNNEDVTALLSNGTYVVETPSDRTHVSAEFTELTKYTVAYTLDKEFVGVVSGLKQIYEGETMRFELGTKNGYEILQVKANGVALTAIDEEKYAYELVNVSKDVEITVTYGKISTGETKPAPAPVVQTTKDNSAVIVIASVVGGVVVVGGIVATLIVLKMKKKKN